MENFIFTASSTCDLSKEYLQKNNIEYVNFNYSLGNDKFVDDFYSDTNIEDFYNELSKKEGKTSQPTPISYKNMWMPYIEKGISIIHIELSSGISGAYNSALIAKDLVLEENKDAQIYVVDSLCASSGFGLLIDKGISYKTAGHSFDETIKYLEEIKYKINHLVIVKNLDQLIKGGRIPRLAGNIGKLLNIMPILTVNEVGKLVVLEKVRGTNNVYDKVIEHIKITIEGGIDSKQKMFVSNANAMETAMTFVNKCKEVFHNIDIAKENIFNIGTVIGVHTGKDVVAIFYEGKDRVNGL